MRSGDLNLLHPGDLVEGRFRVIEEVGAGFLGQVSRAEDVHTGAPVAIKALRNRFIEMPGVSAMASAYPMAPLLRREIRIHRSLNHPRIGRYLGSGEIDGAPWLATEFITGGFASDLATPLPPGEAVDRVRDLLEALSYVHAQGIVHRDVKPENMGYRADGSLALIDFGLSRAYQPPEPMSVTSIMGVRFYSAPENYRAELRETPLSPRADIYSAARVLQRLLLRELPEAPDDLSAIPVNLRDVIARATSESPGDRPATADELASELALRQ